MNGRTASIPSGRAMLGLTVACARCHDHKFDPITMSDYYALAGVFASTKMVNKTADGRAEKDEKAEPVDPATLHIVEDGEAQDLNVSSAATSRAKGRSSRGAFWRCSVRGASRPSPTAAAGVSSPRRSRAATTRSPRASSSTASGRFLRPAARLDAEQLRPLRRAADAPELLDDLARRFMEKRLVRQDPRPRDRPVRHLPPERGLEHARGAAAG